MTAVEQYHDLLARSWAVKRFYERWISDQDFRSQVVADPVATLDAYGIQVDPDDIASLISPGAGAPSAGITMMWQVAMEKLTASDAFYQRDHLPGDPRWMAWRTRQVRRQVLDVGPFHASTNIHSPFAVELSKGCSVGCWFCAVDASRFGGHWRYAENQQFWRGFLGIMQDRLGPGAAAGFLYWATEPLDNPDYELFCQDFADLLGEYPPTTTALALKDPARTRALLKVSEDHGCWQNRFSVVSKKLLDRVHAEFSAEELARVECLPLTRDASFSFGNAGRFRERTLKNPQLLEDQVEKLRKFAPWYRDNPDYTESPDYALATIACVTGFLFNMVDRSVRLISPCTATDEWPLGFYVFGEGRWDTIDELGQTIDRLIERHMTFQLQSDDRVALLDWIRVEPTGTGVLLHGRFNQSVAIEAPGQSAALQALAALVADGDLTVAATTDLVRTAHGCQEADVRAWLDEMLAAGVIDEVKR